LYGFARVPCRPVELSGSGLAWWPGPRDRGRAMLHGAAHARPHGARVGAWWGCAGRTGGGPGGSSSFRAGSYARGDLRRPSGKGCRRDRRDDRRATSPWPASAAGRVPGFMQMLPLLAGRGHDRSRSPTSWPRSPGRSAVLPAAGAQPRPVARVACPPMDGRPDAGGPNRPVHRAPGRALARCSLFGIIAAAVVLALSAGSRSTSAARACRCRGSRRTSPWSRWRRPTRLSAAANDTAHNRVGADRGRMACWGLSLWCPRGEFGAAGWRRPTDRDRPRCRRADH